VTDAPIRLDCARARRTQHRLLDGEPIPDVERRSQAGHVAACPDCRAAAEDLDRIVRAFAGISETAMPPRTLDGIWDRTVRSKGGRAGSAGMWRFAASLVLTAALAGLWGWQRRTAPAAPTEAELRRAASDVRLVLGLTGRAIHSTEQTAIRAVLGREVSGALERLPIEWPETDESKRRRSQT